MKANEIFEYLKNHGAEIREHTCDRLIAGDPNKEVNKLAVCFKLTAELIAKAAAEHFDMIVTHEPTFSQGDRNQNLNSIDQKKWNLLDSTGIAVYRLHDHAHTEPDYIHAGFIRALNLHIDHKYPREHLGICRYSFLEKLTVRQLCQLIKETLAPNFVGIVGDPDLTAETVCLGLGGVGLEQISVLMEPGCDVFITGETDELFANPCHPYTQVLLSAVPSPNPHTKRNRIVLEGDLPSPMHPPTGCVFHTRCPYATARCTTECPSMKHVNDGHRVACHLMD